MAGYIVKVALEDTHPPVWRRLVLPDGITFYDLHRILQTAFEWDDCHLHDFHRKSSCLTQSSRDQTLLIGVSSLKSGGMIPVPAEAAKNISIAAENKIL